MRGEWKTGRTYSTCLYPHRMLLFVRVNFRQQAICHNLGLSKYTIIRISHGTRHTAHFLTQHKLTPCSTPKQRGSVGQGEGRKLQALGVPPHISKWLPVLALQVQGLQSDRLLFLASSLVKTCLPLDSRDQRTINHGSVPSGLLRAPLQAAGGVIKHYKHCFRYSRSSLPPSYPNTAQRSTSKVKITLSIFPPPPLTPRFLPLLVSQLINSPPRESWAFLCV